MGSGAPSHAVHVVLLHGIVVGCGVIVGMRLSLHAVMVLGLS